jgi:N-dimethylarginine dimethylaminohydrolase
MASNVPTMPPLPRSWADRIAATQAELADGTFRIDSMPGYIKGQPPSVDFWHEYDYLEIYPKIYGRQCGANGIGRLREVALVEITESERFALYDQDPAYFPQMALKHEDLDIGLMREQSEHYQYVLEQAGVLVHRIQFPQPPVGAFGPMRSTWAANELLVLRGGSVIEKIAISPFGTGRCEYLALWAFANLGIPPITTIMGTGVAEAGPCFWLAEDVFVTGRGLAYNQEGLDQLIPAVARSAGLDEKEMTTLAINFPGRQYFNPATGQSHHPDMVIGALDVDKIICYPPGLDFRTLEWLRKRGYQMIEVDAEEQVRWAPSNVMLVEPGVVVMHAEAKNTIAAVRKAGVEVIESPYSEFLRVGGGLHCSTLRLLRDKGPYSTDR